MKESAYNAEDPGSIPGLGEGYGYPLQYSCLENCIDREAGGLQPMGLQKSWTQLSVSNFLAD